MAGFGNWLVGVTAGAVGGMKGSTEGVRRAYAEGDVGRTILEAIKTPFVASIGFGQGGATATSEIWKRKRILLDQRGSRISAELSHDSERIDLEKGQLSINIRDSDLYPIADSWKTVTSGNKTFLCVSPGMTFIVRSHSNVPICVTIGRSSVTLKSYGQEQRTLPFSSAINIQCGYSTLKAQNESGELYTAEKDSPSGTEKPFSADDVDFTVNLDRRGKIFVVTEPDKVFVTAAGTGGQDGGELGASLSGSAAAVEHGGVTGRGVAERMMAWKNEHFG